MPWKWLQESWQAVGGGRSVDIRYVDVHRISRYLSKYLTKDLLLSAPSGCRRVTSSRGIKLMEKSPSETVWEFIALPFLAVLDRFAAQVSLLSLDNEGQPESFLVHEENA